MASVIGSLRVLLGLDTAQFNTGLANTKRGIDKFVGTAKLGFAAVAAAGAAASAAVAGLLAGAINRADSLNDLSEAAGVSVETLSRLGYAAKMSGADLETISGGIIKLTRAMEAGVGAKGSTPFKVLGIDIANAQGQLRNADDVMLDIADKFSRLENGSTKTALALQLFGKSGAQLIPFLNQGRAGIAELTAEADRLGITISTKTAQAAGQFNDSVDKLSLVGQAFGNMLLERVAPALASFASEATDAAFNTNILQGAVDLVVVTLKGLASVGIVVAGSINVVTKSISVLWNGINARAAGADRDTVWGMMSTGFQEVDTDIRSTIKMVEALWDGTRAKEEQTYADQVRDGLYSMIPAAEAATNKFVPLTSALDHLTHTFDDFVSTTAGSASSALSGIVKDAIAGKDAISGLIGKVGDLGGKLLDMAADQAIQGLFGWLGGLLGGALGWGNSTGGILNNLLGGGPVRLGFNLPDFANGGSGFVGGSGGTDSQLFMARATPGEAFAFGDDAINGMGGKASPVLNVKVDARGAQVGVAEQIDNWARMKLPSLVQKAVNDPYAVGG